MKFETIKRKYKGLWQSATPGTFERGLYYNILVCLTSGTRKEQAASALRKTIRNIGEEYRRPYRAALAELEGND